MRTQVTALEAMKMTVLKDGVSALKGKGLCVRLHWIRDGFADISIEIVGDNDVPLVEITRTQLSPGDTVTVLEMDQCFTFTLS